MSTETQGAEPQAIRGRPKVRSAAGVRIVRVNGRTVVQVPKGGSMGRPRVQRAGAGDFLILQDEPSNRLLSWQSRERYTVIPGRGRVTLTAPVHESALLTAILVVALRRDDLAVLDVLGASVGAAGAESTARRPLGKGRLPAAELPHVALGHPVLKDEVVRVSVHNLTEREVHAYLVLRT